MASEETSKLFGEHKLPFKDLTRRLKKYIKPEIGSLIIALVLVMFAVGVNVILPFLAKIITENLEKSDQIEFKVILIFALAYLAMAVIGQVITYVESMVLQKSGQRIVYKLRMDVFTHIENMSQDQLNDMPVGALVTRVASYTQSVSELFTTVIINLIRNSLTIIFSYIVLTTLEWRIGLVMLGFVVVVFITSLVFSRIIHGLFKKERACSSDLNTFLSENLSGMKITQVFNQQIRKYKQFDGKSEALRKIVFKEIIAFGIYRPFITFLYFTAIAVTVYLTFLFGLPGTTMFAIYLYLTRFFHPVQELADQFNGIQKAITSCERLFNLLDVEPKVLDDEDAIEIEHFDGHIEFKNVWFAYKDEEWVLKDVSFEILPKQTAAFVGATGSGKTTILSLIVRNYEIQKGQILIDGVDIKKIKIKSLRKGIGQMLQDVFLFSGSIKDNITLHDESFTDEQVKQSCEYVNADKFINEYEKGIQEEVIENGENFSQGQRQLISFARTIIHSPQILILDEATANIDTETEVLIQNSLEKMKSVGTMLVVAHRLSTIQKADQIIVLSHGEVIERGNHQELLHKKGYYYKLYELQFSDN